MKQIVIPIDTIFINNENNENIIQVTYNDLIKALKFKNLDIKDKEEVIKNKYMICIYSVIARIQFLIDNKEYLTKEQISYLADILLLIKQISKIIIRLFVLILIIWLKNLCLNLIINLMNLRQKIMAEIKRRNNK